MEIRKHLKADLERKRTYLFQIGMILSLVFVLTAFEYKSYEKTSIDLPKGAGLQLVDEIIPVTIQKEKPLPPVPKVNLVIEVIDNSEKADEGIDIDAFADDKTSVPDYIPEIEDEPEFLPDDIPMAIPEVMPEFPGGLSALYEFLKDNVNYPDFAKQVGIQGTVYLCFVIEKDGFISNVEILRGIGGRCDEEAVRVVKSMPPWKPGRQMGRPVRVAYKLPIKFTLK